MGDRLQAVLAGNWWTVGGCILLFIVGATIFLVVRRRQPNIGVEHLTELGYICISLDTIESLCLRAARKIQGIRDLTARVRYRPDGDAVAIGMRVIVDGETPIQPQSEQLQLLVKDEVERISGVKVSQVSIYVAQLKQPDKSRVRVS